MPGRKNVLVKRVVNEVLTYVPDSPVGVSRVYGTTYPKSAVVGGIVGVIPTPTAYPTTSGGSGTISSAPVIGSSDLGTSSQGASELVIEPLTYLGPASSTSELPDILDVFTATSSQVDQMRATRSGSWPNLTCQVDGWVYAYDADNYVWVKQNRSNNRYPAPGVSIR